MATILLTGMPRSGTIVSISLLNRLKNVVALAEPIQLEPHGDRRRAVDEIRRYLGQARRTALEQQPIATQHVGGQLVDNWVEPPNDQGVLRRVLAQRSEIPFRKELSEDFTLIVKHPAEFTALADLLIDEFQLFAIVRDPLAVLAAWQTVDMPVNRGRMPMAEAFAPDLRQRLDEADGNLARQVVLIEWQLRTYLTFSTGQVLRYEDLVKQPGVELARLAPIEEELIALENYNVFDRYMGVDFRRLASALAPLQPLIENYYPEFESRWREKLDRPWRDGYAR